MDISWPIALSGALAIVGGVAVVALRPALMRLIDRTSRVGKDGATFDRTQERPKEPPVTLSFDDLMRTPVSASILEREKDLSQRLSGFDLKTDEEKIRVLTRALATSFVTGDFNVVAHIIFGSQVRLLVTLTSTPGGIEVKDALPIFADAVIRFPQLHAERSFDVWLHFLELRQLILRKDARIDITRYGSDFLKHLVDARLTYDRNG